MAFISLLDDRAKPKGSRDPLGFELVWSYFGRKVVGNLTTITSSVENFSVALLGFYWANELNANVDKDNKQKAVRETFLRYEQVAGYLRLYGKSKAIMGVTRVTERLRNEDRSIVNVGLGSESQILSDQASYGLWGLYSSAMRDTGLIKGSEREMTENGISIAQQMDKMLDKDAYFQLIKSNTIAKSEIEGLSKSYMEAIQFPYMRSELVSSLMSGAGSYPLQNELWDKTNQLFQGKQIKNNHLGDYLSKLQGLELSTTLQQCLHHVEDIERVLVAINNIFYYCQVKDGILLEEVVKKLKEQNYDYSYLPDKLPALDFPRKSYIELALSALKANEYPQAIKHILDLNAYVMKQRNGAAWVELETGSKIRVRVKHEGFKLVQQEKLMTKWDYDYFIGSYLSIASSYLGSNHG